MQETSGDRYLEQSNGNGKNGIAHFYSLPVMEQSHPEEDEESLDLKQLLNVAKHRFRLIIAVALGVTTLATLWTLTQKPKYQGSFQVLIEPVNQDQQQDKLAFLGGSLGKGVDYDSQIAVLRSPSVLYPLVEQLKLVPDYAEIEYKDLIQKRNSPLEIEQLDNTKILNISYQDNDPEKIKLVLENVALILAAFVDYYKEI